MPGALQPEMSAVDNSNHSVSLSVDPDMFYKSFIKNSTITCEGCIEELSHNIDNDTTRQDIYQRVNIYNSNFELISLTDSLITKKKKKYYDFAGVAYIVLEDNSSRAMTYTNATNMMAALKQTKKSENSISCFNFGEYLAMNCLLADTTGRVLYYNKETQNDWFLIKDNNKHGAVLYPKVSQSDKNIIQKIIGNVYTTYKTTGTLKIICFDTYKQLEFEENVFANKCKYLTFHLNTKTYPRVSPNIHIESLYNHPTYKCKFNYNYYVFIHDDTYKMITEVNGKYYIYNKLKANSCSTRGEIGPQQAKEIIKKRALIKITVKASILPHEYIIDKTIKQSIKKPNCRYTAFDWTLPIKKPDNILKHPFPNFNGCDALKTAQLYIIVESLNYDAKHSERIKREALKFYPDKAQTADPIIQWSYVKQPILHDLKRFCTSIEDFNTIQNTWAVRNTFYPTLDNKLMEKNKQAWIPYKHKPCDLVQILLRPDPEPVPVPNPTPPHVTGDQVNIITSGSGSSSGPGDSSISTRTPADIKQVILGFVNKLTHTDLEQSKLDKIATLILGVPVINRT